MEERITLNCACAILSQVTELTEVTSEKMPSIEGRILVLLCPLVNLDLFRRGHYHISCRLTDEASLGNVSLLGIKDLFGGGDISDSEHNFPGACVFEDHYLTQTSLIEYTDQSFVFGEYFLFKLHYPIKSEYTEAYVPAQLVMTLDLMFNGDEEMPTRPCQFERVSSRTVHLTIDWRTGLHDHWPVLFDYFHMAALGVTVHASLYGISPDDWPLDHSVNSQRRGWPFNQSSPPIPLVTYWTLLFGTPGSPSTNEDPSSSYMVPIQEIKRAHHVHQMLAIVLTSARDRLRQGFHLMSGQYNDSRAISDGLDESGTTLEVVEAECKLHLESLSIQLQATWEWFCHSAVVHPDMVNFLACKSHENRLQRLQKTFVWPDHPLMGPALDHGNIQKVTSVATNVRKVLTTLPPLYCVENLDTTSNASIVLVEPCPWQTRYSSTHEPSERFSYQADHLSPYLLSSLPSHRRHRQNHSTSHLIVCVHGLQGNQFDLRLYRSFIELALPNHKLNFLMAQSNQMDTFSDFNIMTDRLQDELLTKIESMPRPPTHISFIAHSLGGIIVRSLVTRPAVSHLLPKLHLLLSICGPHLGTQHQTGVVSAGMWVIRKWYQSQSLIQLSLKDSSNPRDTFLYHLSEAQTFECFRHVILLTSPQDKYVPNQSARLCSGGDGNSLLSKVLEEMASRMMQSMEAIGVDLVRVSVHHMLPTSTDSVIGRAAHIAMLDNDLFVEKFVLCYLVKYFV